MRLLEPQLRGRRRASFEFDDLVSVRTLVTLLDQGVPLRRIRHSVEAVRRAMPDVQRPLGSLRLWDARAMRVVLRHEGYLVEPDGQLVLDLSPDEQAEPGRVTSLLRGASGDLMRTPRDVAEEWFERGCRLDTDRRTWAEAIEAYENALGADPEFADAHCNLGTIYYNQNRRGLAQECFQRAIAFEPEHVEAHLNVATVFEEEGRNESALHHYKLAMVADPLAADTYVSLALLYEKLDLPGRGRDHWRRYLQLDPEGSWADVARRHLSSPPS